MASALLLLAGYTVDAQQMDSASMQSQQANQNFSDQQLEDFVEVVKVQQESELEMVQAIQDNGLDLQQFNQILQAQQSAETSTEDISQEQMQQFEKASQKVIEIQQEMQMEVMQAINESGLGVQTYQEILSAYQTNPEVQQQVDQRLTK